MVCEAREIETLKRSTLNFEKISNPCIGQRLVYVMQTRVTISEARAIEVA